MGFGVTELLIIGAIVLLLFGTTKLKSLGSDLGGAIKGFKSAISEDEEQPQLKADEAKPVPEAKLQNESVEVKKDS